MQLPEEPEVPFQINIIPMIDVVFAILTFFITATLVLNRTEGLPVSLPQAATTKTQTQNKVVVTLDAQGNLFLNRQSIALEQLEAQVRSLMSKEKQNIVVINADENVSHGKAIAVMDRIRNIEGVKMAIATKK
ncbi:biopolymer transporter ExbD [Pseudanabaena sp. FACHB-1277]|jgi:biopolymer transport protein ExbD|uniref:Biopolymer transporter ExbD n=1 Tax=Pseudanabaena cinerea FACHB-1277 TaxID=2949581 RepID=A0A926URI5_9CYAN|nr:biopolymer transporter ExbD [Pseudanabaena cinerea]MBD2148962.1 biopolymer transporter ExbD [Pseudanabaena cinerea FACHB-1277]